MERREPVIGEYYIINVDPFRIGKLFSKEEKIYGFSLIFDLFDGDCLGIITKTFCYRRVTLPTIYKILKNVP